MNLIIQLILIIFTFQLIGQNPEIKEAKKIISLGEKKGYKILLPNQDLARIDKLMSKYLKSQNAEIVKAPKGSNEMMFKSVFLKDIITPCLLYTVIEQQGTQVGWTGYFFNEKDTSEISDSLPIRALLGTVYKLSMISLYDDSIHIQSKILKETQSNLNSLAKNATKNDKKINNSKKEIADAEKEIENSHIKLKQASEKLDSLNASLKDAEGKLKNAEFEMTKINEDEGALKELLNKNKVMTKRLKELEIDPTANANLILAQSQDLKTNTELVAAKLQEFGRKQKMTKDNLKNAEKEFDKAKDNQKDANKTIKYENKNIKDANEKIVDKKQLIETLSIENKEFEEKEKTNAENAVKMEQSKLDQLQAAQAQYK